MTLRPRISLPTFTRDWETHSRRDILVMVATVWQVDLAACCTKGTAAAQTTCKTELKPAYDALTQATSGASASEVSTLASQALATIQAAARTRLNVATVTDRAQTLMGTGEAANREA